MRQVRPAPLAEAPVSVSPGCFRATPNASEGSCAAIAERPELRLALPVEPFDQESVTVMQTSTGDRQSYRRVGTLRFTVDGQEAALSLFQDESCCAYNDGWSCPLTPPENRLKVAVRAGERLFHKPVAA